MSNLKTLYERIEKEYYGLRDEWSEYEFEELMVDVGKIAKMKSIYNFIRQNESFTEEQAEHFLKMDNPFQFICSRYNPSTEELHEEIQTVVDDIYNNKLSEVVNKYNGELRWKLHLEKEEYEGKLARRVDKNAWDNVVNNVFRDDFRFDEYDAKVLLQFKEPIFVLVKEIGSTNEPFEQQIERMMKNLGEVDLLTYQHELNKERILPETKQRHDAIIELMSIVPDFHFQTAMRWLDLNRAINESMLESDGEDNPYQEFIKTIKDIKEEHGAELLQKVFDMGAEIVIQPIELVEVAKYLADGGDVDRVSELADEDFFLVPYEEQKQGGMDLC